MPTTTVPTTLAYTNQQERPGRHFDVRDAQSREGVEGESGGNQLAGPCLSECRHHQLHDAGHDEEDAKNDANRSTEPVVRCPPKIDQIHMQMRG